MSKIENENLSLKLESNLIIARCPHCKVDKPNLTSKTRFETTAFNGSDKRIWMAYGCQRCGGATLAWAYPNNMIIREMYPGSISLDDAIPERAKEYLNQAIDSIHAPAGSIMLAASSIDSMLKEKGYETGKLFTRINKAAKDHLITKEMAEWAHEVRLDANDQRHADTSAKLPDAEDAQKTIDFTLELAKFLFIMPSRIQRGIENARSEKE